MKRLNPFFYQIPEYYLVVLVLLSGYKPPFYITPIAIIGAAIVLLQIIFRNNISGLILSGILAFVSLYMMIAVISEFREFPVVNMEAYQLLLIGGSIFLVNMIMTALMINKYYFLQKS